MQPKPGPDEETSNDALVSALLTASRALVGVSARSLDQAGDGVTLTQFRALVVLESHGSSRLNQLAERLGVGPSSALRTVDKLVAAGFVARAENQADRREVILELTGDGRRLVDRVTASRRREIARIVQHIPAGEHEALVDALIAFAAAADEPVVPPPGGEAMIPPPGGETGW